MRANVEAFELLPPRRDVTGRRSRDESCLEQIALSLREGSALAVYGPRLDPPGVTAAIREALASRSLYPTRLAIVAGTSTRALTETLRGLEDAPTVRRVAVSEALARALLPVDVTRRAIEVHATLDRALDPAAEVVLLDRIELLFLPALSVRVLDLLRGLARRRTVVAAWPLPSDEACRLLAERSVLSYGAPGHPEHTLAPVGDVPVWCLG